MAGLEVIPVTVHRGHPGICALSGARAAEQDEAQAVDRVHHEVRADHVDRVVESCLISKLPSTRSCAKTPEPRHGFAQQFVPEQ
jgi:hypothetical protein